MQRNSLVMAGVCTEARCAVLIAGRLQLLFLALVRHHNPLVTGTLSGPLARDALREGAHGPVRGSVVMQASVRKQSLVSCAAAGGSASFSDGSGKATFQHEEGDPHSGGAASGKPKLLVYILFWSAPGASLHTALGSRSKNTSSFGLLWRFLLEGSV